MIPPELRAKIALNPFMKRCIHANSDCSGRPEWEHTFIYAKRQVQEEWAIVPCCFHHHRGKGLDKEYNQYRAIIRADLDEVIRKYPKKDWRQIKKYLIKKYGK